ncbi:uncharacterized protein AC631_05079 [Debaryomyces fabryi]|uniref:F-box domain-containing protein n=1 Tax=Debaryomyces fabryi TaxID=58627 RepID=A0A0V1PSE8_9ASCO|nr:uncharacterized protein AC631_05079 [Debaryomyces fabryi]KRZ99152.1 hypothetical protein AC631_05079 [Debaryomyces fabryi]CUM45087.1 unnamed protein product [Debaryomyces fabryi]
MKLLLDVPLEIVEDILFFLPQQELINLSLTNFQFYQPCMKKLYQKITIRKDPILKQNKDNKRGIDFTDSTQTVIYGFSKITKEENHFKLINARLQSLISSTSINAKLNDYIEEITIFDSFDKTINESLIKLITTLVNSGLKRLIITNPALRNQVNTIILKEGFQKLESVIIDKVNQLNCITNFPKIKELLISFQEDTQEDRQLSELEVNQQLIKSLKQLESISVSTDNKSYKSFIKVLNYINDKIAFQLSLSTFTLNYYHDDIPLIERFIKSSIINWKTIKSLQLAIGCDDVKCNQECLSKLSLPVYLLKKIAFVQNTEKVIDTHKYNEIWDIKVVGILQEVDTKTLKYISIRHKPCENGVFLDGMEGNYLQRVKLYTQTLPTAIESNRATLVLPNFMKSLSCYEQVMNNLLWNGCKCEHCAVYLGDLDEYLMCHKYYNFKLHQFKDIISSNLFVTISEWLSRRLHGNDILSDLDYLKYPFKKNTWNFHDNLFSIPFKCLDHKNYEEHEYDDEEEVDIFHDALSEFEPCKFNDHLFRPVGKCVSHFINDLIIQIVDLNRGNAEDIELDKYNDLNDGTGIEKFRKIILNGICYNLDKELNGTSYFQNVYD